MFQLTKKRNKSKQKTRNRTLDLLRFNFVKMYHILLPVALTLCINSNPVISSGVFEFELIDLQRNNVDEFNEHQTRQSKLISHPQENQNETTSSSNLNSNTRLLICLKEAFTSQLDEPCTFGNSSLTLAAKRQQPSSEQLLKQLQQQSPEGSLSLTNTVRIPFTFRWTKSFTLIVTADQIDDPAADAGDQRASHTESIGKSVPSTTTTQPSDHRINRTGEADNAADGSIGDGSISIGINRLSAAQQSAKLGRDSTRASTSAHLLDRHVLTENEVVPNLETSHMKHWASRVSRNLKSSLAYRFRVYCSINYYGDGCTTFCRPRDDHFGHYNCSSTGQKVCLDGWQGPDCNRAICRPGCSQQHGFCDKPDTCRCRPGWTGARCDECLTYPGCQHGYCLSPWQCNCQPNWGGVMCDLDLNYCGTHDPCKNNGTCINVAPGRYKCQCPDGFAGVDCEINLSSVVGSSSATQLSAGCMPNPCLNGGTCYGFSSHLIDSSATPTAFEASQLGFSDGFDDQTSLRQTRDDLKSATGATTGSTEPSRFGAATAATSVGRLYACQCLPGWSGDYCQWPDRPQSSRAGALAMEYSINNTQSDLDAATSWSSGDTSPIVQWRSTIESSNTTVDSNERAHVLDPSSSRPVNASGSNSEPIVSSRSASSSLSNNESNNADNIPVMIEASPKISDGSGTDAFGFPNMHQLISWVLVASTAGVLIAFLTLAWCCLVAIGRNKLSFIQMNIIRSSSSTTSTSMDTNAHGATLVVTTTLRRMQERIRNSFRRTTTRQHIKPETKLSIENVLRAHPSQARISPPSYDESKMIANDQYYSDDYLKCVHMHKLERPPTWARSKRPERPLKSTESHYATTNKDWLWLADRIEAHPSSWI